MLSFQSRELHVRCAFVSMLIAGLAFTGHLVDAPLLAQYLPGRPALSPMTAVALLVAAVALAMLRSAPSRALALSLVQAGLGALILSAHAARLPQGAGLPHEWWSSPLTGAGLAFSGSATALLASGRVAAGQVIAFAVLMLSVLFGTAHVFPRADLYRYLPGTGVAIPTVLSFLSLAVGQLLSYSDRGASAALNPRTPAGRAGLRLLAAGAIAALAITALVVACFRAAAFDAETAVLLVAWSSLGLLGAGLWGVAAAVRRADLAQEAAESAHNQLRHLVTAALTHDLRNPLHAATMSAVVLQRLVSGPEAAAAVGRLQRSHRRLERLLRSLLDNLALDSGQPLSFHPVLVELDAVARDVIEENDSALRGRVDLQGHATGWWDAEAMFRVIENLLLNAVKYGAPHTPIVLAIVQRGEQVALTVTNQGAPIPPQEWETIFVPFARSEAVRHSNQLGWGVGLSYARAAIAGHGGNIRVASSTADATTFEVTLPTDARPSVAPAASRTA